jgi:hypothetical protein
MTGKPPTSGTTPPDPGTQQATVGRNVHYVEDNSTDPISQRVCLAAIVTIVNGADSVGLFIMRPTSTQNLTAVKFNADKAPGTWHWPEMV